MVVQNGGDGPSMVPLKSARHAEVEHIPELTRPILLPLEIQAMIIEQVAADLDFESRIYPVATRNTLRALCTVSKYFESLAIRYLYTLVHLTTATQLAAFRKAIAYFGRPTALAKHVRTFSVSSTVHIASFQFAQDLVVVLQTLRPSLERLLLDVRRRHYFRQSSSTGGESVGLLQAYDYTLGRYTPCPSPWALFKTPWPKLVEASVSEGLRQYIGPSSFPQAFDNVRRLALGYTVVTADLMDRLLEFTSLEVLVLVDSCIRWTDFGQTSPTERITALMRKSPVLRRFVWVVTPRPLWDMEEMASINAILHDAEVLGRVPGVEVIYRAEMEQNTDDTLPDGLTGPRFAGEGAKAGWLWRL
ncbi:hypothetical protein FRC07_003204 [Ceratobasidium sp. 392]|nr:hypothetical protein FRC07_003204 [Ceratobasidium sp. 392]